MSDHTCERLFEEMVESVGVKQFAANLGLSSRQVYRMLNGVQPNPLSRMDRALAACEGLTADAAVDHLCRRRGGYFVQFCDDLDQANVNAVKECAEAIVAISEGRDPAVTVREVREAVSALCALERALTD
jgi:uncharacterized protein YbjT (DUF2867 family)